jgi:hypothetical protein
MVPSGTRQGIDRFDIAPAIYFHFPEAGDASNATHLSMSARIN